jgi:internalin A
MQELDRTIRKNTYGEYLIIHFNHFDEGIEYAHQNKIPQIQLRGLIGNEHTEMEADFRRLEKLSAHLHIISFSDELGNIKNIDSIYSLVNLEKVFFSSKQNFIIDISKFNRLVHLGSEYWKGLVNIERAYSLRSLVIIKLPDINLKRLSELNKMETLHVYSSKIQSLDGIEGLSIKELSLARNNYLEDIGAIKKLRRLEVVSFEKCKKIIDYNFIAELQSGIKVEVFR